MPEWGCDTPPAVVNSPPPGSSLPSQAARGNLRLHRPVQGKASLSGGTLRRPGRPSPMLVPAISQHPIYLCVAFHIGAQPPPPSIRRGRRAPISESIGPNLLGLPTNVPAVHLNCRCLTLACFTPSLFRRLQAAHMPLLSGSSPYSYVAFPRVAPARLGESLNPQYRANESARSGP